MSVGFIGTGNMGNRLAPRLLAGGYELVVHDLYRESAKKLLEQGAKWVSSSKETAELCEIVFLCLPGPDDVESVVWGPTGVLEGVHQGSIVVDMTTSAPEISRRAARDFASRGAVFLDAPVSSGTLLMVGGEHTAYDHVKPLLDCIVNGQRVLYIGESGMGNIAKLTRQYVLYVGIWTQMEALVMAAKAGISNENISELLGEYVRQSDRILRREFGTPESATARLDTVAKDVSLAVAAGRELNVPISTGLAGEDLMLQAQGMGLGRYDYVAAIRLLEELAGVKVGAESPGDAIDTSA